MAIRKKAEAAPRKNPAAVALGRLRAATMTSEEREIYAAKGGKARARKLSKAQRSEIAKKAAAARWGKKREG